MKHSGEYRYHDDDCRCGELSLYCSRDGACWTCCGAGKEDSECSATCMHPTFWKHPKHTRTVAAYDARHRPVYRSNDEIRAIAPECFIGRGG